MKISQRCIDLVVEHEDFEGVAIVKSFDGWSIGFGHTGYDVRPQQKITRAKALQLLKQDLDDAATNLTEILNYDQIKLKQNQFDALVSLIFSIGTFSFVGSSMRQLLRQGKYLDAADLFDSWSYRRGYRSKKLTAWREAEKTLFLADKEEAFKIMKPSESCKQLVRDFEGLNTKTYKCPAGVPTIGYGHTGPDVKMGMVITKDEAEVLLDHDLQQAGREVAHILDGISVTQTQFDALTDFVFNLGASKFKSSTLLKKLRAGDIKGAANEFLKWDKAKNESGQLVALKGLTLRRQAERRLFLVTD